MPWHPRSVVWLSFLFGPFQGDQAYIQRAMRYEDPMGKGIQERLRATQKAKLRNEPTPRYVSLKDALAASQGGRSLTREEMNRAIKHGLDRRGWAPQGVDIEEELLWGRGPAALPYGDGDDYSNDGLEKEETTTSAKPDVATESTKTDEEREATEDAAAETKDEKDEDGDDDDEYGDCKVCGEPIGFARLRARPESPACVSCMAKLERGQ